GTAAVLGFPRSSVHEGGALSSADDDLHRVAVSEDVVDPYPLSRKASRGSREQRTAAAGGDLSVDGSGDVLNGDRWWQRDRIAIAVLEVDPHQAGEREDGLAESVQRRVVEHRD